MLPPPPGLPSDFRGPSPRRCLLWPALALGGLLLLGLLSVGPVWADTLDTVQAPKPDTAKSVHPDSAAPRNKDSIFKPGSGKLAGQVFDAESGGVIIFAEVLILGTKFGAVTDTAGVYWIINIPPGKYTVEAKALGYSKATKKNIKIQPDLTTVIRDFKLKMVESLWIRP